MHYDNLNNPNTVAKHNTAGGIFKYKTIDTAGNVISPTHPANQANITSIINAVPMVKSKNLAPVRSKRINQL